ncbi:MAG: hypothetical protein ACT4NY_29865 [Pseudonocardiales bacterium]
MAGSSEQAGAQAAATAGSGAGWGAVAGSFQQADAQLVGINGQQTDLQAAVVAGQLWMEAGVAETAAKRCDQAVVDINLWLGGARRLAERAMFGANEDGEAAAERFAQAGRELIAVVENARTIFQNMAATYRAAGRAAAEADEAGQQSFRGGLA